MSGPTGRRFPPAPGLRGAHGISGDSRRWSWSRRDRARRASNGPLPREEGHSSARLTAAPAPGPEPGHAAVPDGIFPPAGRSRAMAASVSSMRSLPAMVQAPSTAPTVPDAPSKREPRPTGRPPEPPGATGCPAPGRMHSVGRRMGIICLGQTTRPPDSKSDRRSFPGQNSLALSHQDRQARRLSRPCQGPAARQHRHVARPLPVERHCPRGRIANQQCG